ncbi:hypothetical protein KKE47_01335 [Patescibacteria group bacterium]|nr:hypothetical protein [Patescibacteria group bacterium]MBU4390041.1 hypothetical protein [Patescibacteria group bacterium]MBU4431273.1 hypothetical protein [Patescibacteria group bacterium]MBU4578535.1 hypothetical protein [Patescibacteria group bacterium]MCG2702284.1 hypothetical protein [Candidatus Parcubacteria bacterium]
MLRQKKIFFLLLSLLFFFSAPLFAQTQTQTILPLISTATVSSTLSTPSSQLNSTPSSSLNPTPLLQTQSTPVLNQPIQITDQSIQIIDSQSSIQLTPLELVVIDKDSDTKKIISPKEIKADTINEDSGQVFTFDQIFPGTGMAYRPTQGGLQTELAFFQLNKYDYLSMAFLIETDNLFLTEQNIINTKSSDPAGESPDLIFSLIPQPEEYTYHLIINFDQDWLKSLSRMPPVITSFLIQSQPQPESFSQNLDSNISITPILTSIPEFDFEKQEEINQPEENSLKVTEFNSNNNPDEFYIPVEDIKGAKVVEFEKKLAVLNVKYSKTATINDEIINNSPAKKELKGDFLSYVVMENQENSDIHAITRSQRGLQKILIKRNSLTSELYESEKLKPELEDWQYKASSTPVYQFKKTETNPNQSSWQDYELKKIVDIKIEENQNYSLITQNFVLKTKDENEDKLVTGQNILKIGFDGENYFSKWTYKLEDNQNLNRLTWQTKLDQEIEISSEELEKINTNKKISKNDINIDWSDFNGDIMANFCRGDPCGRPQTWQPVRLWRIPSELKSYIFI